MRKPSFVAELNMILFLVAVVFGFVALTWSADKFVDGAASTAKHLGMSSLLIGIVIVGFGTSAPEMVVSAIAAFQGNHAIALGNALGSNTTNIGLVLGLSALISPIMVHSKIIKKEMPLLLFIAMLNGYFLFDGVLTFFEGLVLFLGCFAMVGWSVFESIRAKRDSLGRQMTQELNEEPKMSLHVSIVWLLVGLVLLVISSRFIVWGAVGIASSLGVSDLIIGLTIIALGTSLPELATSITASFKHEHDIALGNIVGSNMFNSLAVIGIATVISPADDIAPEVFYRDWGVMFLLTVMLFAMMYRFGGKEPIINRAKGAILFACYIAYNVYLGMNAILS
ncbi:MAG: calcium/sodium antiporter [Sulfurospirillaceae bacterium]|nr:calcium/sodium antiporter [Sulfurospirillaceae bacterium]